MVYHSVLQKDGVHYFALVLKSFFEVVEHPSGKGWVFIMEHMEMRALSKFQAGLGEQLARWDACCNHVGTSLMPRPSHIEGLGTRLVGNLLCYSPMLQLYPVADLEV